MERSRLRAVLERHRSAAQRAISCVSAGTVNVQQLIGGDPNHFMLVLNNRQPAAVAREMSLLVFFVVDVGVGGGRGGRDFGSSIVGYSYTVLFQERTEVVAYHWHPDSAEGSADPHIHFGPASARLDSAVRPGTLHKVHFPTGFVALEDVIRLVIEEFDVEPRRTDWQAILSQRA